MSRYGHEEVIAKASERPYPPILDFVPPPPFPSAASSIKGGPKTIRKEGNRGCVNIGGEKGNQQYIDSSDDYSTDVDDKESLPEFPYDEHSSCVRAICQKGGEEEMDGEYEDEQEMAIGKNPWYSTKTNKRRRITRMIDVQTRLSDISIHEEEYQAALSAGKIHLRGKGQQLYEPILGEVSPEADRIGFHFFLKKTGVLSIIARSMLALYDEPNKPDPSDGIEYMINSVGYKLTLRDNINELKHYKESLLIRYQRLSVENDWLHRALDAYEPTELDLNGRPPNPLNKLEYSTDEFDFAYDEETYEKLKGIFVKKYTPSQEEIELSYDLENSLLSLEEFDEGMRIINPNYLDLTDISSEEDVPERKVQTNTKSLSFETPNKSSGSGLKVSVSPSDNISPPVQPPSDPKKTMATVARAAAVAVQGVKQSVIFKPKRKMTLKSDETGIHKFQLAKGKEMKKGKGKKNLKENSGTHINSHSIAASAANKGISLMDHPVSHQNSLIKLYDPDHEKELNQIIMEEEEDVKKPITWFSYDYEEEDFEDLCGIGRNSASDLLSNKPRSDGLDESDGEEQVPILNDTSDDDTGLENIKPEVHGHLDTQTITGDLTCESDDDKEFLKDPDYQEPELSSDEEDFGRKRKVSAIKYVTRKADSSGEEDDIEWQKYVAGDDQLIDVLEMEPIVPYSSDEDELDIDLAEPPCYEFPVTRTILPTYSHSYRQS